jgi:hypothetical protein
VPKASGLKLRKAQEVILERKASKQNAERIMKVMNEMNDLDPSVDPKVMAE